MSRGRELQGEQLPRAGKAWPWRVKEQTSMNSGRIKLAKSSTETKKLGLTLLRTMKEPNTFNMLYSCQWHMISIYTRTTALQR